MQVQTSRRSERSAASHVNRAKHVALSILGIAIATITVFLAVSVIWLFLQQLAVLLD